MAYQHSPSTHVLDLVNNVLGPVVHRLMYPGGSPWVCVHYEPVHTCWRLAAVYGENDVLFISKLFEVQ